ncbi:MAG: Type 1 glutamine amidotransferase-like domain-containing protein [Clostridia bacterium]|nr:Type 1 glutamine amidotransferase-like domain-containing protein [Clostridia bacterium]
MKLLLCSDFKVVGSKFLYKFFNLNEQHTCLFVDYASEDYDVQNEIEYTSSAKEKLLELGFKIIQLNPDYNFQDKVDMIYVRGGNATKLIHLLRKYNQFKQIKTLTESGVLYAGESAGALIAGTDTEWTLRAEPYNFDVKSEFGEKALMGFGWIDKMIFVHCSKYRFPWSSENYGSNLVRIKNREFYGEYLKDLKIYPKGTYLTLGNNQVLYQNGNDYKILTYNWSKVPVIKK